MFRPTSSRQATAAVELPLLTPFIGVHCFLIVINYSRVLYYSMTIEN
jgi:hypothetical protein